MLVARMWRHVRKRAAQRGCSPGSDVRPKGCGTPTPPVRHFASFSTHGVHGRRGPLRSPKRKRTLLIACLRAVNAGDAHTFMQYRYRPDVLAQLGAHGVKPKPSTSPEFV